LLARWEELVAFEHAGVVFVDYVSGVEFVDRLERQCSSEGAIEPD
jgi:hypothetical protein